MDLRSVEPAASGDRRSAGQLVLDRVTRRFGSVVAVDDVSLEVPAGQLVSFLGPSGCGKTTILKTIAGLTDHTGGSVSWAGRDLE